MIIWINGCFQPYNQSIIRAFSYRMIKLGIARDDIEVHVIGIYNQTTMLIGDRGKIAAPSVNLFYTRIAIVSALHFDSIVGRNCHKVGPYQRTGTRLFIYMMCWLPQVEIYAYKL